MQRFFGFKSFRPTPTREDGTSLQQAVVECTLADNSLLAILPIGGGKSLCYQLPALVRYQRRGLLTIVIPLLRALMKDQEDKLCIIPALRLPLPCMGCSLRPSGARFYE